MEISIIDMCNFWYSFDLPRFVTSRKLEPVFPIFCPKQMSKSIQFLGETFSFSLLFVGTLANGCIISVPLLRISAGLGTRVPIS